MTLAQLILYMMIGTPEERRDMRARWSNFCEKHLIADDPYDEQTREENERRRREEDKER